MAKLLLDETFFDRDNSDGYLDDLINFICKYFEDDIVFFHPYCNPGNLWMLKNEIAVIEMKVMKRGKVHLEDLNVLENYSAEIKDIADRYSEDFIKQIEYARDFYFDAIIFNAPEKHFIKEIQPCPHVYLINHIKQEIGSNIANFVSNKLFVTNIEEPVLNSPLPNTGLCNEYKNLQDALIQGKSVSDRIPIYLQICKEVLQRNTYQQNEKLSSINTTGNKIRDIYQKEDLLLFGSIDIESGSIEICDHNGRHVDEYGFDNQKHQKHDSTGKHDIKLHK